MRPARVVLYSDAHGHPCDPNIDVVWTRVDILGLQADATESGAGTTPKTPRKTSLPITRDKDGISRDDKQR